MDKGIWCKGAQQGNFNGQVKVVGCDTGIVIDSTASPTAVFANQMNFYGVNIVGVSSASSVGIMVRKGQDGNIFGGHITNCLYGFLGDLGESYSIEGVHFETCNQAIRLLSGEHWHVKDCEVYTTSTDLYVQTAARTQVIGNTFNGLIRIGAGAVRTTLRDNIFNLNVAAPVIDSGQIAGTATTLNRTIWSNNWAPTGQQFSGQRIVTQGPDSIDFSIMSTGLIQANLNADSSAFWRLSGKGVAHDTVGLATRAQYRVGHMGIEFGDSANMGAADTPPLAAILSTTNSGYGLGMFTWSGAAVDSLRERFRIGGGTATTFIKLGSSIDSVNVNGADLMQVDSADFNKTYSDRAWFGTNTNTFRLPGTAGTAGQILKLQTSATPDTLYWATDDNTAGDTTAKVLYDPGTPTDSLKWIDGSGDADTLYANGDEPWVTFRSPDSLNVEANAIGIPGGVLVTVTPDSLRPNDSGVADLGAAPFPWRKFYAAQLYLLETTGTDSWIPITRVGPASGQVLKYDGTNWGPGTDLGLFDSIGVDTSGDNVIDAWLGPRGVI
jgi:hypothetical protein